MSSISIVIPVYNVRAYIERCVASILEQTYSDFEALFIDDCATDDSMSVVRRFARNDARIVIVRHEHNRGLAAARNTGIAHARADRITFVDSDDFIAPNLLETMIRSSDHGHFDVVETGFEAIDEDDNLLWRYVPAPEQIDDLAGKPDTILKIREWGVTQKLWRTSLFHGEIKFPEGAFWEDISIVPSLVAEARNLVKVPFVGYSYLQRSDSISNTKSVKHALDMFRAFERYRQYLKKRGIFEAYSATFHQVVRNGADYQIMQFTQSGRETGGSQTEMLVELCKVLRDEYLAGKAVIDRLVESDFERIIAGSSSGIADRADFNSEFRLLMRAKSEMRRGK